MVDITKKDLKAEQLTNIIETQPVLDKMETLVHKDVIEREHIHETIKQDEIEIHEKPILKEVLHPQREIHVQEKDEYETIGLKEAQLQRDRLLRDMREADSSHRVIMEEKRDVTVEHMAPTLDQERILTREVIEKPIVTEVHHQPVKEVHEREIHKTVYEQPFVKVVREAPSVETVSSTTFMDTGPVASSTFVHDPTATTATTGTYVTAPTTVPVTTTTQSSSFGSKLSNLKENVKEKLHMGGQDTTTTRKL